MTSSWTCDACCTRVGQRFAYPPGPDVFCVRCGRPLEPLERLSETLRTLLRLLEDSGTPATARPEQSAGAARLLTVDDVARLLATTPKGIYAQVARGQLPGVMRLGRRVLFRPGPLRQWLEGEERRGRERR